jgi:hypothetical protein
MKITPIRQFETISSVVVSFPVEIFDFPQHFSEDMSDFSPKISEFPHICEYLGGFHLE